MKTIKLLSFTILALVMSFVSIAAQPLNRENFVDFGNLDRLFGDEPKIEVTLKGALLRLARQVASEDEPEMADMMRDIQGIYIRGYEVKGNNYTEARQRISDVARGLTGNGWDVMTRVRDEESVVYILTRENAQQVIQGMTIMIMDFDKDGDNDDNMAMFINIAGRVDPDKVGRMMKGMNININLGNDDESRENRNRNKDHDKDDNKDDY